MADGVPPDQVYAVLGTPAGVDRAFRRLDGIKADLAWWERGAQPAQWLAAGEVAMTNAYNGRIAAANATDGRNFAIVWAGNLYTIDSWVIMKGSPNRARALEFLKFVGQPEVQAGLPPRIPYGVTARGANDRLPPRAAGAIADRAGEHRERAADQRPLLARQPRPADPALQYLGFAMMQVRRRRSPRAVGRRSVTGLHDIGYLERFLALGRAADRGDGGRPCARPGRDPGRLRARLRAAAVAPRGEHMMRFAMVTGAAVLLTTVLHVVQAAVWAAAYVALGRAALAAPRDALFAQRHDGLWPHHAVPGAPLAIAGRACRR